MPDPTYSQSEPSGLDSTDDAELALVLRALATWTAGRGPLYRRLADALQAAIRRGELADGTRMPSERLLAERLLISRSTVVAAYERLRQDDLLERRQGSGTRVRAARAGPAATHPGLGVSRALDRNTLFRRITEWPDEAIDLVGAYLLQAGGLPAIATAGLERELAALSQGPGYAPLGHPPLRRAIAHLLSQRGLPTTPEQVLVTSGAQQALHLAALLYLQPGDTVVVENPTYPGALDAFATAGARFAWVGVGPRGADVDALAEVVARVSPRLIYLIPSFHNPVGGVLPAAGRQVVARLIERQRTLLVDDQTLAALGFAPTSPPPAVASLAPEASILTIDSLSKLGWGGLRVGWIRAPEATIAQLGRLKAVVDLGGSLPAQLMATRLLGAFDELQAARRTVLVERCAAACALLRALLPSWSWEQPQGGLCLWVRLPYGSAAEFAQVALRFGVSIVAGPVASADGSFADYLRLPFGRPPAEMQQGIQRLAAAWSAYAPLREPRHQTLSVLV